MAARRHGIPARTVEAAVEVNDAMPKEILRRIPVRGRRVLVAGVSYKPDVADIRRSAAVRIVEELTAETQVSYHDPYVPCLRLADGTQLRSEAVRPAVADLILLVTKHQGMDLSGFDAPIIDCSGGLPSIVEVQDV